MSNNCQILKSLSNPDDGRVTVLEGHFLEGGRVTAVEEQLTSINGASNPLETALSGAPGFTCKQITYTDTDPDKKSTMDSIIPGGTNFHVCQKDWTTTNVNNTAVFALAGGNWGTSSPGENIKCTKLHPRSADLFETDALVCTDSITQSLATANDLRTIRDRFCWDP